MAFKTLPKYNLKDKKALLRLLDQHDQWGLGGILLEDIEEGLPNSQKAVKALGDQILFVKRPDKKKILFFNDKSCQFSVDEEFQKLWSSVTVDSMDKENTEQCLKRQGISSMQDSDQRKWPQFREGKSLPHRKSDGLRLTMSTWPGCWRTTLISLLASSKQFGLRAKRFKVKIFHVNAGVCRLTIFLFSYLVPRRGAVQFTGLGQITKLEACFP